MAEKQTIFMKNSNFGNFGSLEVEHFLSSFRFF